IARDIRERKAYEARLQYLANYDPLTGLPNRDLLGDRTLQAVAHARRASRPAALLVLNLDRFKLVNESYSRGAGDALLRMVAERVELENELRLALEKSQLEMHYQPQVVLADGRIVGVEALMRWNHAQRGSIPPGQFIPVAEDSDLIHPLGAFALAESCRQIRVWGDAGSAELG